MINYSNTQLADNALNYLQSRSKNEIDFISYIQKNKLKPHDRERLIAQIYRSETLGIKYKYVGATVRTVIFLKK